MKFEWIYVYALINLDNKEIFYIGSTKWDISFRLTQHKQLSKRSHYQVHKHIRENKINTGIEILQKIPFCDLRKRQLVEAKWVKKYILLGSKLCNQLISTGRTKKLDEGFTTIKVTELAAKNFKLASAYSGRPQYEMSEEGSHFVHGKYIKRSKNKPNATPQHR